MTPTTTVAAWSAYPQPNRLATPPIKTAREENESDRWCQAFAYRTELWVILETFWVRKKRISFVMTQIAATINTNTPG